MAKKIGIRLYLDGASQFKSDVKGCDASLKEFQSELKKTSQEFKGSENSIQALSKKSEALQKAYDTSSKKVEAYSKRLTELNKAREQEKQKLESYKTALDQEKKKLEEIEKTSGKSSEAYEKQAQAVDKLQNKVDVSTAAITRLDNEEVKLNTSLNNATAEQLKYGSELEKTNTYLGEAEKSADGYAHSIDGMGKELKESEGEVQKMSESLSLLAETAAFEKISEGAKKVLESMIECAEVAEKFEYSIAKVQSIAQVSGSDLEMMSKEIRHVGAEMGYGSNEIAEAVYQAISASVDASKAVGFVEDATKLARAGFTESATAVDVLTTAINAYGKEANTTKHIADDLITTQNLGKTTVDELAQSIGTVIPTASALGVSLDQLSTAYVLLTKQGINTANATTYIRAMMNELSDAGSDVSVTLGDLTGHTFGELMAKGYTLGDVMQILGESVNGNGEAFKNLFSNVRSGLGALSLFNQGADAFNDTLKVMETNAGATDKAFETMADTAEMTNERFKASAENLQIAIGEALSPALEGLKEAGIGALEFITDVVEQNPEFVAALAGAATAVGVTATAVTGLALAISVCKAAFGDFSGIAVMVGAGLVAATGGIAGYALAASNAKTETEQLSESLKESAEAAKETDASARELLESQEKNGEYVESLVQKIKDLNSVEHLSNDQKLRLKTAVKDLNLALGETVVELDQQTDHLKDSSGEWEKNAEARAKAAEKAGVEEKYNEVIQEQAKVKYELWDINEQLEDIDGRRIEIDKELLDIQAKGMDASQTELDRMQALYDEDEQLTEQENVLKEALQERGEVNKSLAEDEQKLADYLSQTADAEHEAAEAAGEYTDSLGVVHESSLAVADAEEAIETATERANEAIDKQIGLFDEWNTKSSLTFEDMQKRWEDQTKGVNQYSDDLDYLADNVIYANVDPALKDLAQSMIDLGVGSSAELHEFVTSLKDMGDLSDKNNEKVKKLTQVWKEHEEAISNTHIQYEALSLSEQGYVDDSNKRWEEYAKNRKLNQETFNTDMTDLAIAGVESQAKGVGDTSTQLEDATETMMEKSFDKACNAIGMPTTGGTSSRYSQLGSDIIDSIADGINGGDVTIGNALGNALQNAVNHIDVASVANKINEQLGTEVNRAVSR